MELLEETANSIKLQNVLDSESFPPVNALKRMIINVQAMITDTVMALEIKDNALLDMDFAMNSPAMYSIRISPKNNGI